MKFIRFLKQEMEDCAKESNFFGRLGMTLGSNLAGLGMYIGFWIGIWINIHDFVTGGLVILGIFGGIYLGMAIGCLFRHTLSFISMGMFIGATIFLIIKHSSIIAGLMLIGAPIGLVMDGLMWYEWYKNSNHSKSPIENRPA